MAHNIEHPHTAARTVPQSLPKKILRHPLTQFVLFVLLIVASRSAIADWNYVPSGSMKPTLMEGDLIFVNRLAYDLKVPFTTWHIAEWGNPDRGDIVVAYSPENGQRIVKRVVALPGDFVEFRQHSLVVNGHIAQIEVVPGDAATELSARDLRLHGLLQETLLGHSRLVMVAAMNTRPPELPLAYQVPAEHYVLIGDNRDNSHDSRIYGPVPRRQILGEATHVIGSVDIGEHWQPRWGRFFTATQHQTINQQP